MKNILLTLFLFSFIFGNAQNLVPNGDFENNVNGVVTDWLQPTGQYYHYTTYFKMDSENVVYNSENGLCLLNNNPSEYLVVPLKKTLEEGKVYCIKTDIRIIEGYVGNVTDLHSVEFVFTDQIPVVTKRTRFYMKPDIVLNIDPAKPLTVFQTIEETYTARGDEKVLIIGKFFTDEYDSIKGLKTKTINELNEEKSLEIQQINDSFLRMYPPVSLLMSKSHSKKFMQKMSDSISLIWQLKDKALDDLEATFAEKQENAVNLYVKKSYHIRTHFDNICIAPIKNDQCSCNESEDKRTFESGRSYILQNVHFDLDKATLKAESFSELENLFQVMIQNPEMSIQINGHTDSLNSEAYNLDLSTRRAKTVYDYLFAKGISSERLKWKGYGESMPLTNNTTEEGRAMNRRVEFIVLKK